MADQLSPIPEKPVIGIALGSGAARGWAHLGVMRALKELDIDVQVYAGCSAGSLVAAAHLLGITDEVATWAKSIGPISAFNQFSVGIANAGLVNPDRAFDQFRHADKDIQALDRPFGAVATDLSTGQEVWLTKGSALDACRASSAVPLVLQAASYPIAGVEHWLVDGAISNPVPVTLARSLGATRIIAVDLNDSIMTLSRFVRPTTREVVAVDPPKPENEKSLTAPVETFFKQQSQDIARRFALAKARANAKPQFFETATATMDIIQSQLARARARADAPDVRIAPNLSGASPAAFDQWDYFEEEGYKATLALADSLLALKA